MSSFALFTGTHPGLQYLNISPIACSTITGPTAPCRMPHVSVSLSFIGNSPHVQHLPRHSLSSISPRSFFGSYPTPVMTRLTGIANLSPVTPVTPWKSQFVGTPNASCPPLVQLSLPSPGTLFFRRAPRPLKHSSDPSLNLDTPLICGYAPHFSAYPLLIIVTSPPSYINLLAPGLPLNYQRSLVL